MPERDARSADLLRIAADRPILDGDGSPGPSNTAVVAPAPDDPEPVDSSPGLAVAKRREIGVRVKGCPKLRTAERLGRREAGLSH